jgi:hypothetical protein
MRRIRVSRTLAIDPKSRLFSSVFLIAILSSCGGNASAPPPQHVARESHAPTWRKLSWQDRHEVMTFTVLPNMAQTWQAFTKTDAPTLTCRTCHGENAEAAAYQMPSGQLTPLDPDHLPSKNSSDANEARWTTFMTDQVVPQMIDLLDVAPYDPQTAPHGFGCFTCHEKKSP